MPSSPKYFKFDQLRCDRNTFKSQMHRNDPTPFSPRWLSGYEIIQRQRTKKYVSSPKRKMLFKSPSKRSYPNQCTTTSQIHLDHKTHRPSRPLTAPNNVYRVWDSSKPVNFRSNKRQFPKTTQSKDRSVSFRSGKRQIKRAKRAYPQTARFGNLRLFPERKEASIHKPNSTHVPKTKRLLPQKNTIKQYMTPSNPPKILNLSAFPREKTADVWKAHTPINPTNARPKTSQSTHYQKRSLISSIMCHS